MRTALWGRITGADKQKAMPDQQASILGRLGDYIVIYPYGMYCNLPDDVWLKSIGKDAVLPVTSSRPTTERGEIVLFHPVTGAKIYLKKNGDIDAVSPGDINATCKNANITASVLANINGVEIDPSGNIVSPGACDAVSYSVSGTPGVTGAFTTTDGKTVTVTNGIITNIV